MRHAINVTNFGDYADPRTVARLARLAEQSGWDALFVWDHLAFVWPVPAGDPWIILSAAALSTDRILLGTAVTPVPRRRPWVLAHQVATLDLMTDGRVVLGVGLGGQEAEFTTFGEDANAPARGGKLDEGLDIVSHLLGTEKTHFDGEHYHVSGSPPAAMRQPRPPIWIGGNSRSALRRAARWDGWMADSASQREMTLTPDDIAGCIALIREARTAEGPFDVSVTGYSIPEDGELVAAYEAAGATWWQESLHGIRGSLEEMIARIAAGPVRG